MLACEAIQHDIDIAKYNKNRTKICDKYPAHVNC